MGPETAAGDDIDQPEEEGENHRITEVLMDQGRHTVFGDPDGHLAGNPPDLRRPELNAGHHEHDDDQCIDPVPYSDGQRMEENLFHRFTSIRSNACAKIKRITRKTRITPARSIHLRPSPLA